MRKNFLSSLMIVFLASYAGFASASECPNSTHLLTSPAGNRQFTTEQYLNENPHDGNDVNLALQRANKELDAWKSDPKYKEQFIYVFENGLIPELECRLKKTAKGADAAGTSATTRKKGNGPKPVKINENKNYSGEACSYFVVKDEESCQSRSCFYTEGQVVAVGKRAYRCELGTWTVARDCTQSPTAQQSRECVRDIRQQFGTPQTKEVPAQSVISR